MSTHSVAAGRYAERIANAQAALPAEDAYALLLGAGADLQYLTGYGAHDSERLTMLVVPATGRATLVLPRLELALGQSCTAGQAGLIDLAPWEETEDPITIVAARLDASDSRPEVQLGALGGTWGRLGGLLVSDRLFASFLLRLQAALPDAAFGLASTVTAPLRLTKDAEEIALLRKASLAADRVVEQIAAGRLVGRTEADVSKEVFDRLVAEGHDSAEFAIVASGPNGASPHHQVGEKVIQSGEPIVLDIGGRLEGYWSDTTRTLWVTGDDDIRPTDEFTNLYGVLQQAQAAQRAQVKPGVIPADLDAVGRDIIAQAGYGDNFIHRTGHGTGLDGHEDPYIVSSNDVPLVAGNVFSIEPGIYIEGRFGARIEDQVACGPDGVDELNVSSHDLYVVRG
ncbi:MAG TPA: Xaa-Pro peptidase family protein [Candidatus Limnocylindria bacterium]|nr:Xaa-Pro peptidase family protein [Candidatus Limnocylindria bacterium]